MSVSPEKRIFKCWSCGAGGDVVDFVMKLDKVDFRTALGICKNGKLPEGLTTPVSGQGATTSCVTPASPVSPPAPVSGQLSPSVMDDMYEKTALWLVNYYENGDLQGDGTPPGGRIKWAQGSFYRYSNGVYEVIPDDLLNSQLRTAGRRLRIQSGENKALTAHFFNSTRQALRDVLVSLYIGRDGKPERPNSDPNTLNMMNCLLNVETREATPHTRDYFSTTQLPVVYDPQAECPWWKKTLEAIFAPDTPENRKAKIQNLQQAFGYGLSPKTDLDKFFVFYGPTSRNGKDLTLYQLLQTVGPKNYSGVSLEQLNNYFNVGELVDKLVNISGEIGSKTIACEDTLKKITGGSLIHAEVKCKGSFDFIPCVKLYFAANNPLRTDDQSPALYERMVVIRFPRHFKPEERIPGLKEQIFNEESSGIFNWMLEGLRQLRKQGRFIVSKQMQADIEEFRRENSSVLSFGEDWLLMDGKGRIPKARVYGLYRLWSEINGQKPFSKNRFSRIFKGHFPNVRECKVDSDVHGWDVSLSGAVPSYLKNPKKKIMVKVRKRL